MKTQWKMWLWAIKFGSSCRVSWVFFSPLAGKRTLSSFYLFSSITKCKVEGKNRLCLRGKTKIGVFSSLVSLIFTLTFKILIYLLTPCHTHSVAFPVFEYSLPAPIVFKGFFHPIPWTFKISLFVSSSPLFNHFIPGLSYIYLLTPP